MADQDWKLEALCRGLPTELFVPDVGQTQTVRTSLEMCNGTRDTAPCPVRQECLDYALSFSDDQDRYGIFGGTLPSHRLNLRRERRRKEDAPPKEVRPPDKFGQLLAELVTLVHDTHSESRQRSRRQTDVR